ncbi:chemotaxis protein CheW [Paenibacillus sp. strain BS8-2]
MQHSKNLQDPLLEMFVAESSQLLERLEAIVLENDERIAANLDRETINEIFRVMHTIKGSSAMMGFAEIAALTHNLEDLFAFLREKQGHVPVESALFDLILDAVDHIKVEIFKIVNGDAPDGDCTALIERSRVLLNQFKADDGGGVASKYQLIVHYQDGCEMENVRAYQLCMKLQELAQVIESQPTDLLDERSTAFIREQGYSVILTTTMYRDELEQHIRSVSYIDRFSLTYTSSEAAVTISAEDEAVSPFTVSNTQEKDASQQSSINVSVTKLDELMNLVGEMVIAEAMVTQIPEFQGLPLEQFRKAARHLSKITSEIQDTVMSIRMVALSQTFQRMNRIVRDMNKKLDKDVRLTLIGGETEVDKGVIDQIANPLMHLVRNAIDHGIELPEQRVSLGKSAQGTITIEAQHVGNEVLLTVRDDGKGLNRASLIERARSKGIITSEQSLSDQQAFELIFAPGFSTKDGISEFSGRGVGMDVVRKDIEAIGGHVTIESRQNEGTAIQIKIPLTITIIDGMNIRVGTASYSLPTTSIQQSFRPQTGEVFLDPSGNELIFVRGQCLPIVRLHRKFATGIQDCASERNIEEGILIVVEQDGNLICLFADELLGQQQIVVKALPPYLLQFNRLEGIAGCTLLGDGSISLILDTCGLIRTA